MENNRLLENRITALEKKLSYPIDINFQKVLEQVNFNVFKVAMLKGGFIYAGSSDTLPGSWKIENIGVGNGHFRITHNLKTSKYIVVATPIDNGGVVSGITTTTAVNSFDIFTYTSTTFVTPINADFNFILIKI